MSIIIFFINKKHDFVKDEMLHSDITHFSLKVTNHYSKLWKLLLVKNRCMVTPEFIHKKWLEVVSWWKEEGGLEAVPVLHILLDWGKCGLSTAMSGNGEGERQEGAGLRSKRSHIFLSPLCSYM